MNQKNMILIIVAVACGLFAAFLTTRMRPSEAAVEQVPVLVAAKDLALNARLTSEEIDTMVIPKMFTKDSAPPVYVSTKEEMIGKRLARAVRAGSFFVPQDLTDKTTIDLPDGYDMITFPISKDQLVGGFAPPGSRVDIIASVKMRKRNSSIVFPLRRNMLILAIDVNTAPPPTGGPVVAITNVSMAVTKEDAMILHAGINRGAQMRLIKLNLDKPVEYKKDSLLTDEQIWKVLGDIEPSGDDEDSEGTKVDVVELPVPNQDLEAGTQLTEEVINSKFTMTKIVPPAPANVISNIREHEGKFLTKPLSASQFVPKSFLAANPPRYGKPEPMQEVAPEKSGPDEPAAEATENKSPPVYWDVMVLTSSGQRKYRYQVLKNGTYKYIGEVKADNAPVDESEKGRDETEVKPKKQTIRSSQPR